MNIKSSIAFASVVVSGIAFLVIFSYFPDVFSHHSENWSPLMVIFGGIWAAVIQTILIGVTYFCSRDIAAYSKRYLRLASIGFLLGTFCLMLATYLHEMLQG